MVPPAISVILPSRGRPESLRKSAASLLGNAASPDCIEILAALDPDDAHSYAGCWPRQLHTFRTPERYGYAQLHRYYNRLAGLARGRWLFVWNDDCLMCTRGWDAIVARQPDALLTTRANHGGPGGNFFPLWPRAWAQTVGQLAPTPNVDVWLQDVARNAGCPQRRVPVEVFHDRRDVTGGHDDQTYAEGRALMGVYANHPGYASPENLAALAAAAATVRSLIPPRRLGGVAEKALMRRRHGGPGPTGLHPPGR